MIRIARVLVVLAALLAAACGGSEVGSHGVRVAAPRSTEFTAPQRERLERASAAIANVAGHPLTIELDLDGFPELPPTTGALLREKTVEAFVGSVEKIATDLAALSTGTREHAMPLIDRIVLAPFRPPPPKKLDVRQRALFGGSEESIVAAIHEEYRDYLMPRFNGASPESLAPKDRRDYFEYLIRLRDPDLDTAKGLKPGTPGIPHGPAVRAAVTVWNQTRAGDRKLAADIHAWLLDRVDFYHASYIGWANVMFESPAWRDGERAWIGWLNAVLPSLSDDQMLKVARNMVGIANHLGASGTTVLPGLDPIALATGALERRNVSPHAARSLCTEARRLASTRGVAAERLERACGDVHGAL